MKFRYKILAVILAAWLVALACLTASCGGGTSPSATAVKDKSFIWQVSSPTNTVYLLGSVHVAKADIYPLDSVIEDAFARPLLVVEVNLNEVKRLAGQCPSAGNGPLSLGDAFHNHVSSSLYVALEEQFARFGGSMAALDPYRPWVVYMSLEQLLLQELGYLPENGIDYYFLDKAAQSKLIIQLETAAFQLEMLYSMPDEIMIAALEYDLENMAQAEDMEALLEAWEDGDAARWSCWL